MTTANTEKCKLCGGTEFRKYGTAYAVCSCVKQRAMAAKIARLNTESGLRGSLLVKTFENYHPRTPSQKEALEVVKAGGNFFLIGEWGVGKSHLLAASVNDAIKKGVPALFCSVPWLCQMIRDDLFQKRPIGVMERVCEVEYLALDDLGKEKPTETVQEKLFMILDRREIDGLRTSVTSNYTPETLSEERLDGAIIDRIVGMCNVIAIDGGSYRKERQRCKTSSS